MYFLGTFAFAYSGMLTILIGLGITLTLSYFYIAYTSATASHRRIERANPLTIGTPKRKSIFSRMARSAEATNRDEEEFMAIMKMSSQQYGRRTIMITAVTAIFIFIGSQSFVLTIFVALYTAYWYHGRGAGKVRSAREDSFRTELLPYARYISRTLRHQSSIHEALSDLVRSDPETPLKASLKRALSSTRTLEAGLRQEAEFANQRAVKEFLQILAEGASSTQKTSTTQGALDRFFELNLRARTVYQRALQVTAQARGTRMFLTGLIPFFYVVSLLRVGPDLLFHTTGGDVITFIACGSIAIAYLISNRFINNVLKGF